MKVRRLVKFYLYMNYNNILMFDKSVTKVLMETNPILIDIDKLKFINTVIKFDLPIDTNIDNDLKLVRGFNFSRVKPTPLKNVKIAAVSVPCLDWMGIKEP